MWSFPAAKRMSNVAVVVPKSGSSLWADLWVCYGFPHPQCIVVSNCPFDCYGFIRRRQHRAPQDSRPTKSVAEPEAHLLHSSTSGSTSACRVLGAYPSAKTSSPEHLRTPLYLESPVPPEAPRDSNKRRTKLDTNLVRGVPPPEILERCEFLEPLSGKALEDYR
jgi:hypothetical protein